MKSDEMSPTRRRIWAVVMTTLAMVFSFTGFYLWEKYDLDETDSTPPPSRSAPMVVEDILIGPTPTERRAAQTCCMVNHVHPGVFGENMAEKFREDRIRDSAGRAIQRKIVDRMVRYAATKAANGVKVKNWWYSGGMHYTECMTHWSTFPAGAQTCMAVGQNPTVRKINRQITGIKVLCGGAAVIASLKGGGWVGAGRGALGCVWTKWAAKAME